MSNGDVAQSPPQESPDQIIERILSKGDISGLTLAERNQFLVQLAKHYGLDPAGRPFDIITTKEGRVIPYANRQAAEQLRRVNNISLEIVERGFMTVGEAVNPDVYVVRVRATIPAGGETPERVDEALGAVSIKGKQGEDLANCLMKAETKAKRRATYSICALGMLDELEVQTIPNVTLGEGDGPRRIAPGPNKLLGDVTSTMPEVKLEVPAYVEPIPTAPPAPAVRKFPPAVPPITLPKKEKS